MSKVPDQQHLTRTHSEMNTVFHPGKLQLMDYCISVLMDPSSGQHLVLHLSADSCRPPSFLLYFFPSQFTSRSRATNQRHVVLSDKQDPEVFEHQVSF